MKTSDDPGLWSAEIGPEGPLRTFAVAFLGVWLCGWAMGEALSIAAAIFLTGLHRHLPIAPELRAVNPPEGPLALGAGAFVLVWLTLWSFGGVRAARQIARVLAGRDELRWNGVHLEVTQHAGPLAHRRRFTRDEIHAVLLRRGDAAVMAATDHGPVELTTLGSAGERGLLCESLRRRLSLPRVSPSLATAAPALPPHWEESRDADGRRVFRVARARRRGQALAAAVLTLVAAGALAFVGSQPLPGAPSVRLVLALPLLLAVGIFLGWSVWLACASSEWRVGAGRLEHTVRFGGHAWNRSWTPPTLRVRVSRDGEDAEWCSLEVSDATSRAVILRESSPADATLGFARLLEGALGVSLEIPEGWRDAA